MSDCDELDCVFKGCLICNYCKDYSEYSNEPIDLEPYGGIK